MNVIAVSHLSRSFGKTQAVADVSFEVRRGEIFGLLGPNGAGKTTTIRMMLDIYRPDSGSISILDGPMSEDKKDRIGYMPEERGLYQDVALENSLVYLAILKGLSRSAARRRVGAYLERFDLARYRGKKVKELSKGMQQKAQIIAAVAHDPELLIIDEPFASLDPVNARAVTDLIRQLAQEGTTILMSTHQMHQVEELCHRIVLIDKGRNVLYGELDQIRRRYAGNELLLRTAGRIPSLDGVAHVSRQNGDLLLALDADTKPEDVLAQLVASQTRIEKFQVAMPTLDEVFVRVVTGAQREETQHA